MKARAPVPGPVAAGEPVEAFPEHAKVAPHSEVHWEIRDFLAFLADRGVFLSRVQSGKVVHVTTAQVNGALLEFRGVDVAAFEAESRALLAKYGQVALSLLGDIEPGNSKPVRWLPTLPPPKPKPTSVVEEDARGALLRKLRGDQDGQATAGS